MALVVTAMAGAITGDHRVSGERGIDDQLQ
jgi:hypothetical protein